jgi:hypothetical protein
LGLKLQKVDEVILNLCKVGTRFITNSRKKNSLLGVPACNSLGVQCGKCIIPQVEQSPNLFICDGLAHGNFFWHYTRVVVLNLPDAILLDVVEGVSS